MQMLFSGQKSWQIMGYNRRSCFTALLMSHHTMKSLTVQPHQIKTLSIVIVLKFETLFSFCTPMICGLPGLELTKMLVRIAKREDPDQTTSSEAV